MPLYIGVNYNPHDWPEIRWKVDIDLMKKAGFTTVRLGHLWWDSYEPNEGFYAFSWFDRVLELFAEAGLGVVLDISMSHAPVWVHKLCPGCIIHGEGVNNQGAVGRYTEDVSDASYQHYALRFAKLFVDRYKSHPAIYAFALGNELGVEYVSRSPYVNKRFINWLKKKYGAIDALNAAWSSRIWSRRFTAFSDIFLPNNEVVLEAPEAWLDLRRFFSDGVGSFLIKLKEIVSTNAPGVPHSSNSYSGIGNLGFDYLKVHDKFVDYPGMGFYPGYALDDSFQHCNTLYKLFQAETGQPMWCLEFQSGHNGIFCGPKGYIRMHALLCLMNGAQMILGSNWRTMLSGKDQFRHGLLGHDGILTQNYHEYQQIAADMKKLQDYAFPYVPRSEIAIAFSQESLWESQYNKEQFRMDYMECQAKISYLLHSRNLEYNYCDLRNLKNEYKLIVIPYHVVMEPAVAETIRNYVAQGGTVIMTGYSGTIDETGKAFSTPKPGGVDDVFGINVVAFYRTDMTEPYQEGTVFSSKSSKRHELLKVEIAGDNLLIDADYYEEIRLVTARTFATFSDKGICAVSVNDYGKGSAYYIAAEPSPTILGWLVDYLIKKLDIINSLSVPEGIQARKIAENQYFYVNTTDTQREIHLEQPGKGILTGEHYHRVLVLSAYDGELIVS